MDSTFDACTQLESPNGRPVPDTYRIGNATIAFKQGWTEITLNSGAELSIPWTEQPGQAEEAAKLGYASAVDLNRDHDAVHVLVAHMLGLPDSGPLSYAAGGPIDPHWYLEEAIVFAVQRYIAAKGWTAETILHQRQSRAAGTKKDPPPPPPNRLATLGA